MIIKKKKVVVLGAGLAGLAAADEILQKGKGGFEVTILEKQPFIGGLSATFENSGFRFDLAPHRWFTKNEELNQWVNKLMGKEMIWVKKYTPMYQFNKFFNYPIEIMDVIRKINPLKIVIMLFTYVWARISNLIIKKKIITMKDAYVSRFGYALYVWFNKEFNEKLWGRGGCETMSADFVQQRTRDLSISVIIKNALGIGGKVVSLTPKFQFPKLGIGRISDKLAERIKQNGGVVKNKLTIQKINKDALGYRIVTNQGEYRADLLVSSIPVDELIRLMAPKAPPSIIKAISLLQYVHQKVVVLLADKPKLTDFTWVYVHPPAIKFFRFLETNNWSVDMSPKGKTSLVFEYPYQTGDELGRLSDDRLIDMTINDFIKYFSPVNKKADILKGLVFKVDRAYPKYDLYYRSPLGAVKNYLKKTHPKIQLVGRNGMFRYNNMDHAVFTGQLAARNILAGRMVYNIENVNEEAEYLEEKQV